MSRAARLRVPLGLFALAFAVRMLSWTGVFYPQGAHFVGNDAYYHMRRVLYGLAHFPDWLDFDPYLNFPNGARPIWTPVFDWLSTLIALPFAMAGGDAAAEWIAAVIPPLLGASCVVVLYFAARRCFDESSARIAGVLLALLTAHVWYSQVGFFDHHAAVGLAAAGMLWASVQLCTSAPRLAASLALSLTQAGALLLWPGMLLHVALIELAVALHAVREREHGVGLMRQRAAGHLLAGMLVAPLALSQSWPQWGDYSATVLSRFQPWLFAAMAAHAAATAALWRRRAAAPGLGRAVPAAGAAVVVLAASILVLPGLVDAAADAWRWLGKQEQFQSQVAESKGILLEGDDNGVSVSRLVRNLSGFGLLLPVLLIALSWRARGRPAQGAVGVIVLFSGGLLLATLQQRRFGNSAAIGTALVAGWALQSLWTASGGLERARLARAGIALATALLLLPTLQPRVEPIARMLAALRGIPVELDGYLQTKLLLLDAGRWLREHSGEAGDLTDLSHIPSHAVMAPWHLGHRLLYASRLPTVVGNFGDDVGERNFELHRRYLRSAEPQAARRLDRVHARFVVTESLTGAARDKLGKGTMIRRLAAAPLRDLAYHRIRYATEIPQDPQIRSYRVFERVAGAEIAGEARPGAPVRAQLLASAGRNRALRVVHEVTADERGRYRLRVAQPSEDAAAGGWRLHSGERQAKLVVPLQAVLEGAEISGPDLR